MSFSIHFLERFSIKPVKNLEEFYEYGNSKMKKPYEYEYSKVEKPHRYGYTANLVINKANNANKIRVYFAAIIIDKLAFILLRTNYLKI